MSTQAEDGLSRERLIRGEHGWWFLGPGGRAQVAPTDVTADGMLTPATERVLRDRGLFDAKPITTYSLTVLTTTHCNLGCGYCFQNLAQDMSGGSRPPRIERTRLTSRTITDLLAFTGKRMAEANLRQLSLLLFGGEPLLNPKGCVELLARAHEHGLARASMTSNCTLLTPAIASDLEQLGLRSIQVTFDGDRDDHDRIRVRHNGSETFDTIVRNLSAALAATRLRLHIRVNVSQRNIDGIGGLLDFLAAKLDTARCSVSLSLVGDVGIGYGNDLRAGEPLVRQFADWYVQAHELGFDVPRPSAYARCQSCSYKDGQYGAVVNADGVLYSCWETAGKAGWRVGSVRHGYLNGVDARWVSCQAQHRREETAAQLRAFQDGLDAALLDRLAPQDAQ